MRRLAASSWLLQACCLGLAAAPAGAAPPSCQDLRQPRLLVATSGAVFWYDSATGNSTVVHSSKGIYHGVVSDGPDSGTAWLVARDSLANPANAGGFSGLAEALVQVNLSSGEELRRAPLGTRWVHDAVINPRGDRVYVAHPSEGSILQLAYPSMQLERTLNLFTRRDHINTLRVATGADGAERLWAMMHRKGKESQIAVVAVDDAEPAVVSTVTEGVGHLSHQIVGYRGFAEPGVLVLDSQGGAIRFLPRTGGPGEALWTAPDLDDGTGKPFLKGLTVIADVAYFGVNNKANRMQRHDTSVSNELAAFDLQRRALLWRRTVPSAGLINTVAAPHLAASSSYEAVAADGCQGARRLVEPGAAFSDAEGCAAHWDAVSDASQKLGLFKGDLLSNVYRLPISFDVARLQQEISEIVNRTSWSARQDIKNWYVPLVTHEGQETESRAGPFRHFGDNLARSPYVREVMDAFSSPVGRSRLMMVPPGGGVKRHFDAKIHVPAGQGSRRLSGQEGTETSYWGRRFRIHIPVYTEEEVLVSSWSGPKGQPQDQKLHRVHMALGSAWLLDNTRYHQVDNHGTKDRIHLVFDTVGSVRLFELMAGAERFGDEPQQGAPTAWYVPFRDRDARPVLEAWVDPPVFEPMPASDLRAFLEAEVLDRLDRGSEPGRRAAEATEALLRGWEERAPSGGREGPPLSQPELERLRGFVAKFRRRLALGVCREAMATDSRPPYTSAWDALDVVSRMLLYECSGQYPELRGFSGFQGAAPCNPREEMLKQGGKPKPRPKYQRQNQVEL